MSHQTTLIIGNGFSIGLSRSLGLEDQIQLQSLYPPPPWLAEKELPMVGTGQRKTLVDPTRYPELFKMMDAQLAATGLVDLNQLGISLASYKAFDTLSGFTFHNRNPGVQIRYYLWHLFNQYDEFLHGVKRPISINDFRFLDIMISLLARGRLVIISYNYDCFAEDVVVLLRADPNVAIRRCVDRLRELSDGQHQILTLKPHGSIAFGRSGIPGCEGTGLSFVYKHEVLYDDDAYLNRPRSCPSFPDLVPPGHSHEHYALVESDVAEAAKIAISESDLVINWGFSARAPDDVEYGAMMDCLRKNTCVFCVDIRRSGAYDILRSRNDHVELVHPGDPADLQKFLRCE